MSSDFEEARRWAAHWAQRWFLDANGADRLRIDGIDAGWATHVEAYGLLLPLALERVGSTAGRRSPSLVHTAKRLGVDRAARMAGLRILRAPGIETLLVDPRSRVAFVVEIPTPSMLQPAAAVAATLGAARSIIAAADPRAYRRLAANGLLPIALTTPWKEERSLHRRARSLATRASAAVVADPPRMTLRGEDLTASALKALRPLMARSIPWLGVEVAATRRLLERAKPVSVALASDQHRIGRIAVQLGAEMGVPSVVLQHGLPQGIIGLLPVVAPQLAAWSEASRDWFVDHGTTPAAVTVTGNPRLDEFQDRTGGRHNVTPPGTAGLQGTPRILVALSPGDPMVNMAVVQMALDALPSMPGACMVVKLHPGGGDWRDVRTIAARHPAAERVRVLQREPLYPLFEWADVTLLHRSTVAIESLAAGTPVGILATPEAPGAADLELSELRLPQTDRGSLVPELISSLASTREDYFSERREALQRVVGPLDGRSSERVAELLLRARP